jgi:hypothetical protein
MGAPETMVMTPMGMPVNFQPSIAVSIGTSASSTFSPGLLYLATGGDIAVVPSGQTASVLFAGFPSGEFLPVWIKAVVARSSCDGLILCN